MYDNAYINAGFFFTHLYEDTDQIELPCIVHRQDEIHA